MRILFIVKRNTTYGFYTSHRRSAGLYNSTRFIVESLIPRGIEARIVEVQDNNGIDREVTLFKPDVVVLEALWVVPEKFDVLMKLHPNVGWQIHLHSNIPFLAMEGMSMDWVLRSAAKGVGIIANSAESYEALQAILPDSSLTFLPNVYLSDAQDPVNHTRLDIRIGCFGAIRPLKNQLLQALAAIQYAKDVNLPLEFHVNGTRVETGGEPVKKNLIQLFEQTPNAKLILHDWMEPEHFIRFLHHEIDLGMQVSLTETFNVVTADYVTAGLPVVVSNEVAWASDFCKADEHSLDDIVKIMHRVTGFGAWVLTKRNQSLLQKNSRIAQELWFDFAQDF